MKDPKRRNEIVSEAPKGPASPPDQAPPGNARKDAGAPDTGQAAAAAKNRETTVRLQIVEAFQQLGISDREWPDCVRRFYSNPEARKEYIESNDPLPFQPPAFDRLHQSPEEWTKVADAAWQRHRDGFLKLCQSWVTAGVDQEIPPAKSRRGPGRNGRRLNAPLDLRYKWAARRLNGAAWKEIAGEFSKEDQVKKAAVKVLKAAGWFTKDKIS